MVVAGLTFVTDSLNAVPVGDGISDPLSSATIITGRHPPDLSCLKLTYGDYIELHVNHKTYNSTKPCSVPCITLHSIGNTQGGYYFMDLHSGHHHIDRSWMSLPMTGDAIARVEQLALDDGQSHMHQGPIIEFAPDVPVDDLPVDADDLAAEDFPIDGAPAAAPLAPAAKPVSHVPLFEANPVDAKEDATYRDDDNSSDDKRAVDPVHVHDPDTVAPIQQAVEPVAEPVAADDIHDNDNPFGILGEEEVNSESEEEVVSFESEEDQGIEALQHVLQETEANFNADEQEPSQHADKQDPVATPQYQLRSGSSFGTYANPQQAQTTTQPKPTRHTQLPTFDDSKSGYKPTTDEMKPIVYCYVVNHTMEVEQNCAAAQRSADK